MPISIRVAAGSATISDATDFIRAREGGKIIQSDAATLSELNRMMALTPDRFIGQDLDAYRNQISRNDLQELKQQQIDLLKQDSQALKRAEIYKATFEQADQLLQQLGRSSIGPNGETDPEVSRLNAKFFVNLKARVDYELDRNEGQALNVIQIHDLIQKQLAADFPDQAADLQALQDVSSSVSTSDTVAVPMPEGIKLPNLPGIGATAKRAGLAIVSAPAALLAGAFVLAGTNSAGGEDINESFDLGDYGSLNVTGHGSAPARTLTITAPDGSKTIITGRLEQDEKGPRHFTLKSGTIEDRAMTPGELRYFSSILSGKNVNAVYSESTEDGEEEERPPPGIGDNSIPSGVEPIDKEQPTEEQEGSSAQGERLDDNQELAKVENFTYEVVLAQPDPEDPGPPEELILYRSFFSQALKKTINDHRDQKRKGSVTGVPTPLPQSKKVHIDARRHYTRIRHERRAGYILAQTEDVIFQPEIVPEDGLDMSRKPDYRINGEIWDCYSVLANQTTAGGIRSGIWRKVRKYRQTKRLIIDMTETSVSLQELSDELAKHPVESLVEIMIIARK